FAADRAGHCRPTRAEGIRTALYCGIACGRDLREVIDGRQTREQALERYGAFCDDHAWAFDWLWRVQSLVSVVNRSPRAMTGMLRGMSHDRLVTWAFNHYLPIAPPGFAHVTTEAPLAAV